MELHDLKYLINDHNDILPGWNAQSLLSPPYRENYDLEYIKTLNPRSAAVMVMLYQDENDDEVYFPLIMRVSNSGIHSSQFSLPGGQFEESDISFDETAIRETMEELGVDEENLEIIKQLSELYIPPSNFLVYPFVGIYHGIPQFNPQESEVQFVLPINLDAFLEAKPVLFERDFSGTMVDIPGYELGEEEYLWGATAMILEEFKVFVKNLLSL